MKVVFKEIKLYRRIFVIGIKLHRKQSLYMANECTGQLIGERFPVNSLFCFSMNAYGVGAQLPRYGFMVSNVCYVFLRP